MVKLDGLSIFTVIAVCGAAAACAAGGAVFLKVQRLCDSIEQSLSVAEKQQEKTAAALKEEIAANRFEDSRNAQRAREELSAAVTGLGDSLIGRMSEIAQLQGGQMESFSRQISTLTASNEQRLEKMRETVESSIRSLQQDNSAKLDLMREVVDEKLHATLENRLRHSFTLINDRLEQVYKGLGEMQTLAAGVGDLKKVLTNVKARGTWGEMSLGFLLEQVFTPEQYACNVVTRREGSERVEYAVKLPGRTGKESPVWLPIDAKFPEADYRRLVDAQDRGDPDEVNAAAKQIESFIRSEAAKIHDKYIDPPFTTDFGIMFLPVESLYAEVLRRPGLCESLQRDHRIVVAGPTTIAALLNSLQMGFRTLAIEQRSSEVWTLLGAVKTEFGRFGDILEKTRKKLREAGSTIEDAARRSRSIERKLIGVQELPAEESGRILGNRSEESDTQ